MRVHRGRQRFVDLIALPLISGQRGEANSISTATATCYLPPPEVDGPPVRKLTSPGVHNCKKRQAARSRKEEYRTKRELKAKVRKEKAIMRAKKKKEQEEILRKKGERLTKNQPKIVEWFRRDEGGQRKAHAGGKTGVG